MVRKHIGSVGILYVVLTLTLGASFCRADVCGRALLTDAASRVKPGNLILCTMNGGEKKLKTLITGDVIDARFSPDGRQVVYGIGGMIKILDLGTGKSSDLVAYTGEGTYFNWCLDNRVYWSDGADLREIMSVDVATKEKKTVHKGIQGRTTLSLDGKRAAWVMPPRCAFIGGKQFSYMGGCGGAVSPSGKYLTSNLTTGHKLMGIFTFDENGVSEKPLTTVVALGDHAINGFFFGRQDEWVCYTVEGPEKVAPIAYIAYWKTDEHIEVAPKHCIKDYFDESDLVPDGAVLDAISVCAEGPMNVSRSNMVANVGIQQPLKVVGHYSHKDARFTPQIRDGITWKTDTAKVAFSATALKGVAECSQLPVTAEYKGRTYSFNVTVLPELTGDGFKAEYFKDLKYTNCVLTRVDPFIDFRWSPGTPIPDPAFARTKVPWSVRWSGTLDVQKEGEYTFYFMQGEGNDQMSPGEDGVKTSNYSVWIDGKQTIAMTKNWNYPWAKPKAGDPVRLTKGEHSVKVMTLAWSSAPVVAQLYWSGPGIKQSLLGAPYIHSNMQKGEGK